MAGSVLPRACAIAMYWNGLTVGSVGFRVWFSAVFTMNRSYVPRPIRVRVTPLAGDAQTLIMYPPNVNAQTSAIVPDILAILFVFIVSPPIFGSFNAVSQPQVPNPMLAERSDNRSLPGLPA